MLGVGSIAPRKNQMALVQAWNRLYGEFGESLPTGLSLVEADEADAPAPV